MKKEMILGAALGGLLFLIYIGVNVLPVLAGLGLMYMLFTTTNLRSMGKGFATVSAHGTSTVPQIKFDDIGGQSTAKQELLEALDFLRRGDQIKALGIRPLKGILLIGPPGTGKTLLAKAAATYTDSVFMAASGSDFVEMYAGVGAQRVRKLFEQARDTARKEKRGSAIVFVDEFEVLGARRGSNSSHMEYDQTLNALLVEMDGLTQDEDVRVLVMAATNRVDMLDPAITRPGRFDRIVKVDLPDKEGRAAILRLHVRNKPMAPDVDIDKIAQETFGFSGAHLESVTNEAAILALRDDSRLIALHHLREAVEKVMLGEKLDRRVAHEELQRVAIHEIGHALISEAVRPGSVASITITPRGNALGYMRQAPQDDQYLHTKRQISGQIRVCLAGAVAEQLLLGEKSTGASGDYSEALRLAKRVVEGGLSDLGIVDPEVAKNAINDQVSIILKEEEAVNGLLDEKHGLISRLADHLLSHERISGEDFRAAITAGTADVA